jgi:hypothetical protein
MLKIFLQKVLDFLQRYVIININIYKYYCIYVYIYMYLYNYNAYAREGHIALMTRALRDEQDFFVKKRLRHARCQPSPAMLFKQL